MVESLYPFATSMCSSWSLSLVQLCATLWTVAHQAPLSMGFFRQEYWSGLPFSSSRGIFLTQGSNLCLLCLLHYGQILYFLIWEYMAVETVLKCFLIFIHVLVSRSCVWLFVTPWTAVHQALLSMEFFSQEYWSGLPFPSPGDLPNTRITPHLLP